MKAFYTFCEQLQTLSLQIRNLWILQIRAEFGLKMQHERLIFDSNFFTVFFKNIRFDCLLKNLEMKKRQLCESWRFLRKEGDLTPWIFVLQLIDNQLVNYLLLVQIELLLSLICRWTKHYNTLFISSLSLFLLIYLSKIKFSFPQSIKSCTFIYTLYNI